ncbi:MAG TPA: tetratricopeptide repeat protein [Candidatus Hydrogenedentes bacterium]|nr:tetratricopeptide repeat protein [Candidatus Hydrogenedentota bacterium]
MGSSESEAQFSEASQLYVEGRYDEAIVILDRLDMLYPDTLNILKARARTLGKLRRYDEAIALCERLASEFGYHKAHLLRERLLAKMQVVPDDDIGEITFTPEVVDDGVPTGDGDSDGVGGLVTIQPAEKKFRIKPVRLILLLLIVAGMYTGYVPYWLGGGLIVAYFLMKYAIRAAVFKLFSLPFKMKGKALKDATVEMHGFEWTGKPEVSRQADDDDEPESEPAKPLRYVWIDVTITPPVRTQGFTHWEPGELMLAPFKTKIKSLDDMDKCFGIHDYKFIVDGAEMESEGSKVRGPQRIKVLAGVPEGESAFKFMYYSYCFGELKLTG